MGKTIWGQIVDDIQREYKAHPRQSDPSHPAVARQSLDYWRKQPTSKNVESLKPGSKEGGLLTKQDGSMMNGNTQTKVLEERGYDINTLPRQEIPPNPLDDPFWFEK